MAFLCQIPTVLQAKHAENISENRQSAAVKSSTKVKVAVIECLSMESILVVIIAEKSIHWKYIFLVF